MNKNGHVMLIVTGVALVLSCLLVMMPILSGCSTGGHSIGGDWRTQRGYSRDYKVDDSLTVTFSYFNDENSCGYAVYDASCGARMGSLILPEEVCPIDPQRVTFRMEDHNGDGQTDIGVQLTEDQIIWYSLDHIDTFASYPILD